MIRKRFATPPKDSDLRPAAPQATKAEVSALLAKVAEKVAQDPGKAAKVLSAWLQEPKAKAPSLPKKKSA